MLKWINKCLRNFTKEDLYKEERRLLFPPPHPHALPPPPSKPTLWLELLWMVCYVSSETPIELNNQLCRNKQL